MTDVQDKPDKFMEILCAPERGPVEWERPVNWNSQKRSELCASAYRFGLGEGMDGRPSAECAIKDASGAAAYALGWMRGTFPRPFVAEEAEAPTSDDADA